MDSESQIALLLAQVDAGIRELEHTVDNFEQAVAQAERCLEEIETPEPRDEEDLQLLEHALRASQDAAMLVRAANTALDFALTQTETAVSADAPDGTGEPLAPGTLICDGRYRLIQLLHSRPRVHLYLARRLSSPGRHNTTPPDRQPLVAIRELVLSGLAPALRQSLVRAAFEEFAAPQLFGSPHLPGVGDHLYLEDERHYLIMQPRQVRGDAPTFAQPLTERLADSPHLDMMTALQLGTRLCQTVARLHRQALYLGELTPAMILVDPVGSSAWAPLLLASWPPAPYFWPGQGKHTALRSTERIFPTLAPRLDESELDKRPFVAPEIFEDQRDARSDVYTLGAILYLLCTGSVPVAASHRMRQAQISQVTSEEHTSTPRFSRRAETPAQPVYHDSTLTAPRLLNEQISPLLEQIILRALSLKPEQRFASARDLAEALESMHFKTELIELPATPAIAAPFPRAKASRLHRLFEWLKR
jgi:serine/threonine protein kinase